MKHNCCIISKDDKLVSPCTYFIFCNDARVVNVLRSVRKLQYDLTSLHSQLLVVLCEESDDRTAITYALEGWCIYTAGGRAISISTFKCSYIFISWPSQDVKRDWKPTAKTRYLRYLPKSVWGASCPSWQHLTHNLSTQTSVVCINKYQCNIIHKYYIKPEQHELWNVA